MARKTFVAEEISRLSLPAHERRGVFAQEVVGSQLLVVTFHQTSVDLETIGGVTVEADKELRNIHTGISDTVLIGSVSRDGVVFLLDLLMLNRKSVRGEYWKERLTLLDALCGRLPKKMRERYRVAPAHTTGLIRRFDEVVKKGGLGLLLRREGIAKTFLCNRGQKPTSLPGRT